MVLKTKTLDEVTKEVSKIREEKRKKKSKDWAWEELTLRGQEDEKEPAKEMIFQENKKRERIECGVPRASEEGVSRTNQ